MTRVAAEHKALQEKTAGLEDALAEALEEVAALEARVVRPNDPRLIMMLI